MHEILTLQFGSHANHLGTHYWNTQESYFTYPPAPPSSIDHDKSFRPGLSPNGEETYSPRTLIYDLKGAFGTLRRENALYELSQQDYGNAVPMRLPTIEPSAYQLALDAGAPPPSLTTETVRYWSDYNHLFFHPRSLVQLNEYALNSTLMPFERWSNGEELFANLDREHDLLDRDLRPWLEECDQLQGIQVFTGTDDAWGGFAAGYLERLADELGKGSRWIFGLQQSGQGETRAKQGLRAQNAALSLRSFNDSASLYVPLTSLPRALPGYVKMNGRSAWHTSALQAALVESLTLPTRLKGSEGGCATFEVMEAGLTSGGRRRVAAAGLSVVDPAEIEEAQTNGNGDTRMANGHANGHSEHDTPVLDITFLPSPVITSSGRTLGRNPHIFNTVLSLRGAFLPPADITAANASAHDRFDTTSTTTTYQSQLLLPTLPSFPQILRFAGQPEKVAVKTSLSTSTGVAERIRAFETAMRRTAELDEREALCEGLATIAEEYEDGWSDDEDAADEDE